MISAQPFSQWLKQRRKTLDLTQPELARLVGCAVVTIQKIEEGRRRPSKQVAELLATHLGVAVAERTAFLAFARKTSDIASREALDELPSSSAEAETLTNLPAPLNPLIGRMREVAELTDYLVRPDIRLVTLVGPPGVGKTRLSIHLGEQVRGHFRDGIWFVDLAPLTDAALVLPAIAAVLTVMETGVTPLAERLPQLLRQKQLLLILDNFEQVSAAATTVVALLQRCKGLKVLATSRTPLHLTGEYEFALPPLSLPPLSPLPDLSPVPLLAYEAVALFVARVRQHQPTFALTIVNAASITTICRRLDGLPLALELAAAALRRITLPQLGTLLQGDAPWLHQLHSPARDLPPRQRTLYQAIAWSYSLLDANVQASFRQVGVFVGGFTAAAAQAICGADQTTLDLLTEHSLLVRTPERWRMLEMIREFALTQMHSEERTAAQQRHAAYFVAQPAIDLATLASDHANFRTALLWAIGVQDVHPALTLCIKLCWFWETHGYLREGITMARAALAIPGIVDPNLRIDALERVSTLAWQSYQFDIALQFAEEAAGLARTNDQSGRLALVLNLLGRILIEQGDYRNAEAALQESAHLARQLPHLFNPGCPLTMLGEIALTNRELAAAHAYLMQALPFLNRERDSLYVGVFVAMAHTHLAEIALSVDNPHQARHELQQALPQAHLYIRRWRCLLVTLAGLLLTVLHTTPIEDAQAAAAFLGAEVGLGEQTDAPNLLFYQSLLAQRSELAQQRLPHVAWQAAWQVGHSWTQVQAIAEAEKWLALGFDK